MSKATKGMGLGGMSKHRKAGKTTKSPKLRHSMMLEAQKNERKGAKPLPFGSVQDAFHSSPKAQSKSNNKEDL